MGHEQNRYERPNTDNRGYADERNWSHDDRDWTGHRASRQDQDHGRYQGRGQQREGWDNDLETRQQRSYQDAGLYASNRPDRGQDEMGYRDAQRRGEYGQSYSGKGPKGYSRSDDRLKEEVNERLMHDHDLDASEIEIEIKNGEVTLSGTVESRQDKFRAEQIVDSIMGVKDVTNTIRVNRNSSSGTGSSMEAKGSSSSSSSTSSDSASSSRKSTSGSR